MNDLSGQSFGRYHLIEKLGEGGMAVVYKAFDTRLECEVAVKVIRTEMLAPVVLDRALKRFEREAKAVAKLTHPNIVKVTDYGSEDEKPYLVMPYLPGGTLKELIIDRGQIPWDEAAKILTPITEALDYAHSEGVIHRDIKPSNILLTRSGQPMLTDFGVAKIIEDESTQDLTGTSATVGTPEYMAPEQITSKTVDGRADLYALGVVFYEMITARRPYEADTPMAVLFKHANEPLPRPSQFVKELPQNVEQFLLKALTKNPNDRYQSAAEMLKSLQALFAHTNRGMVREKSKPVEEKSAASLHTKNFPVVKWVMAGLAVVALLIVVFILGRSTGLSGKPAQAKTVTYGSSAANSTQTQISNEENEPTNTQIPVSTATSTPAPVVLTVRGENQLNCRNVSNEAGTVLKILDPDSESIVNGTDATNTWINVQMEPVTSPQGEEISDCWVYRSDLVLLSSDAQLPIIESRPIYEVWHADIYAWSVPNDKGETPYFREDYYDFTSSEKAESASVSECEMIKSKGARWCHYTVYGPYLSDLWTIRGRRITRNDFY